MFACLRACVLRTCCLPACLRACVHTCCSYEMAQMLVDLPRSRGVRIIGPAAGNIEEGGDTALSIAVAYGDVGMVRILVDALTQRRLIAATLSNESGSNDGADDDEDYDDEIVVMVPYFADELIPLAQQRGYDKVVRVLQAAIAGSGRVWATAPPSAAATTAAAAASTNTTSSAGAGDHGGDFGNNTGSDSNNRANGAAEVKKRER